MYRVFNRTKNPTSFNVVLSQSPFTYKKFSFKVSEDEYSFDEIDKPTLSLLKKNKSNGGKSDFSVYEEKGWFSVVEVKNDNSKTSK